MSNKKKLIPALRFPEFKEDGEWEYLYGNKLFQPISNKNHASDLPILAITQDYGAIPRELIDYTVIASKNSVKNYKVVEQGDFIISLRSFQGGIEYSSYQGICSPAYIILRKRVELEREFYKYYFKTPLYIQELNRNLEGIRDGKMVSYSQFSEISLPFPPIPEQQKIADCLSSLDDLLAAHNEKLDLLKGHKKGLMQNLFPQEGERVPKFRFPEFENDGEWEEKKLGEILIKHRLGGNYENTKENAGIPLIKMGNIERGSINLENIQYLPINTLYNDDDILKEGDLLFNTRNTLELVGKVAIWRNELPFALYNSNLMRMTFDDKLISSNSFMNHLFNTRTWINKLKAVATGTTSVAAIYTKDLHTIMVSFPSKSEQQKIASCLSAVDDLIKAETGKIEALKAHKKGLMQGLFPKMEN